MKINIYKKCYLDTNSELVERLKLLLEVGIDDKTYYNRFNDIYSIDFDYESFAKFLNAKSTDLKSYAASREYHQINFEPFLYETDDYNDIEDSLSFNEFYNNYRIAYFDDDDLKDDKIYRTSELARLVREGKIVLLYNYEREEAMDDDMFMDDVIDLQAFGSYPFNDFNSLDDKTKELTMRIIYSLAPIEKVLSDIEMLNPKVKKIEHK